MASPVAVPGDRVLTLQIMTCACLHRAEDTQKPPARKTHLSGSRPNNDHAEHRIFYETVRSRSNSNDCPKLDTAIQTGAVKQEKSSFLNFYDAPTRRHVAIGIAFCAIAQFF
jgi:hypothetical protein